MEQTLMFYRHFLSKHTGISSLQYHSTSNVSQNSNLYSELQKFQIAYGILQILDYFAIFLLSWSEMTAQLSHPAVFYSNQPSRKQGKGRSDFHYA